MKKREKAQKPRNGGRQGKIYINTEDVVGKRLGQYEVLSYAGSGYDHTVGGPRRRHYYNVRVVCKGITHYRTVYREQIRAAARKDS